MTDIIKQEDKQIEIKQIEGRTQIVFKKAILKGKVTTEDVLNSVLIAARMQAEKYIEKLSRGAPLDVQEVKALKELAEITKLEIRMPESKQVQLNATIDIDQVKANLYTALTSKLQQQETNIIEGESK